jgi:hypothetical protein
MTLQEQQALFARSVAMLINHVFDKGYSCTLGEAFRTPEQAELNAKKGTGIANSLHCRRLAIDINLFKDGKYLTDTKEYHWLGSFWEVIDKQNRWGGRFGKADGNHFERKPS